MNAYLIAGISIVIFALVFYSIFVFTKKKNKRLSVSHIVFLTLGVLADMTSTTLMIIGSTNTPFTIHGFIGYTALSGMLIDSILIWKHFLGKHGSEPISVGLFYYTWSAYAWWAIAFLIGALMRAIPA